jgi:microcystin-dependent protein
MGTPYMGEIKIIAWNFAPQGWSFANGQFLPINQNQALFSLLGTMYGGNGQTTFALPDLRGRVPIHMGDGFTQGQAGGENAHTLTISELPAHIHFLQTDATTPAANNAIVAAAGNWLGQTVGVPSQGSNFPVQIYSTSGPNNVMAPQTVTNTGGSQAHNNMQPYLGLNMIIALQGVFPSRN